LDGDLRVGERGLLVIRPEKFSLVQQSPADQGVMGRVSEHVYVGDFTRYRVEIQGGLSLTVKVQNNRSAVQAREGEEVQIFLNPGDARILKNL
jgi:ABC-type Fe3+/spermidine/putrescine transport system ATPase subunit